jgi:hypothetical protein
MKGGGFESGLPQIFTSDPSVTSRRDPLIESVTVNNALSPLEFLLLGDSGTQTVTPNSFPQASLAGDAIAPDRGEWVTATGEALPSGVRYSESDDLSRSRGG